MINALILYLNVPYCKPHGIRPLKVPSEVERPITYMLRVGAFQTWLQRVILGLSSLAIYVNS